MKKEEGGRIKADCMKVFFCEEPGKRTKERIFCRNCVKTVVEIKVVNIAYIHTIIELLLEPKDPLNAQVSHTQWEAAMDEPILR